MSQDSAPDQPAEIATERQIDELRLMKAFRGLARYDVLHDGDDEAAPEAVVIWASLLDALQTFIDTTSRAKNRGTIGKVRPDLRRLGRALTELQGAWAAANGRTVEQVHAARGEPFEGVEARPLFESVAPLTEFERGVYRNSRFRQDAAQLARVVARLAKEAERAGQDRRHAMPGLGILTDRLAAIFTERTGRPLSTSRNVTGALGWIQQVVEALPADCRPSADMVAWSVRHAIKRVSRE